MTRMQSLKAALISSVCLLPLQALAQSVTGPTPGGNWAPHASAPTEQDNWITIGGQYQSGPAQYLGRFSGATHPGFYGLGDLNIDLHDAWNSGGTRYFRAQGSNLGFDDRSFAIQGGQQGTWSVGLSYDGIPYYGAEGFGSVYTSTGTLVPGVAPGSLSATMVQILPPVGNPYAKVTGFTGTAAPPGTLFPLFMPKATNPPTASLYFYDIHTQRDIFTGTGTYHWGDWTITGTLRHEHKDGYYANSAVIAGGAPAVTSAGSRTSTQVPVIPGMTGGLAYFAQPVDYDMDRYDLQVARGNSRYQVQLGYTFSQFTDNNSEFLAQNPFKFFPASNGTLTSSFGAGVSPASLYAPYSLPPSNSAHQVKLMFGYNFTPTMRLMTNFEYSLQMQNQSFVTGTGDPVTSQVLPRSSFDGLVQTTFGNIAFTAEPLPRLDVRLAYTIDNRDNQSPRNAWTVFQRSDLSNGVFYNMPFSYQHQMITAEAGYRILPQTKLMLSDTYDYTWRNFSDTAVVTSNTVTAKVRSEITPIAFGSLAYSHQDRTAHNYNPQGWWQNVFGPAKPGDAEPSNFLMYFEASRTHDEVKGTIDLTPLNNLTASMMVKYASDRYPSDSYGLRNNHNLSIGPDISWQVTPAISAHAFYTYEQLYYDQTSVYESSTTAAINTTGTGSGYFVPWQAKTTDAVHTAGVSLDWQAIKDVLKFSLDYSFSYGDTAYSLGDGGLLFGGAISSPTFAPSVSMQPLPDVTSTLNMVSIRGEYTFRPNMTLLFGYAYERFSNKDFMNNATATQYANALLPGTLNPNEGIHLIGASFRYRF